MPLPQTFSFDTESDLKEQILDLDQRLESGDFESDIEEEWCKVKRDKLLELMTVKCVQICPVPSFALSEVVLFLGNDALEQFWKRFEENMPGLDGSGMLDMHAFNLGYESRALILSLRKMGYRYVEKSNYTHVQPGEWTMISDDHTDYAISVRNANGVLLRITDDMKKMPGTMAKVAKAVREEHPDWWPANCPEVKESTDYHAGWLDPSDEEYEKSLMYARLDAFSQAQIARYIVEGGFDKKLTAPGLGFLFCIMYHYGKDLGFVDFGSLSDPEVMSYENIRRCTQKYHNEFPPLGQEWKTEDGKKKPYIADREMQRIAERCLLGGFVYGRTGTWHGVFCHVDYSSSYPYEYAFGELPAGKVHRWTPDNSKWDWARNRDDFIRAYIVSFDFVQKEIGMPLLTGKECATEENPLHGAYRKKMKEGHVTKRLYTETYLEEMSRHYEVTSLEIHEMWWAKKVIGPFKDAIEFFYNKKNHLKEMGMKDSALYMLNKLFMNGGIHGKPITKTKRRKKCFNDETGKFYYTEEESEPTYGFLVGFFAMQNARTRLARHCRMVQEAGYHVMMTDTDSMVVDCDAETLKGILGDEAFETGKKLEECLGRFDFETDADLIKNLRKEHPEKEWNVSVEFDEFKCWGLKRYCEVKTIDGIRYVRKTACAGVKESLQAETLKDAPTDGTEITVTQLGRMQGAECTVLADVVKHFKAENIYYEPLEDAGDARRSSCGNAKELFNLLKEKYEYGTG